MSYAYIAAIPQNLKSNSQSLLVNMLSVPVRQVQGRCCYLPVHVRELDVNVMLPGCSEGDWMTQEEISVVYLESAFSPVYFSLRKKLFGTKNRNSGLVLLNPNPLFLAAWC